MSAREVTILIIEDNEQNRYLMRFLLVKHGFRIIEAVDGVEGIATARAARPDLILLDIQLPGLDGFAVLAELRKDASFAGTPIVVVTSHAMVGDRQLVMDKGADEYIEKPIDPETFVQQVSAKLPSGLQA